MDTEESPQQGTGETDENRESTSGTNDALKYVNGEVDSEFMLFIVLACVPICQCHVHTCLLFTLMLHLSSLAKIVYLNGKYDST